MLVARQPRQGLVGCTRWAGTELELVRPQSLVGIGAVAGMFVLVLVRTERSVVGLTIAARSALRNPD